MTVTRQLAEFLATTTFDDLPSAVTADAQRSILDWLGSALAGADEPPARMSRAVIASLGASTDATVFGGGRASAAAAALANGISAHILELDDIHKTSTIHAGAPIISAALAVAEREHADGAAFILAVALGYEAALRIGEAVNPSHYRYWHPTGTAATFGAAAAAGSLLGLNSKQMLDALGTAGTQAAGLWEFNADGAMSKHLHPGKAAFNGIIAADLALAGFTGATRILEGPRGFFQAMSESFDASRVLDELGTRWKVSENCYKMHSCCGHTHTAADIALELRGQVLRGGSTDSIESAIADVHIETYGPGFEIVKEARPKSPYQAKFSMSYVVAVALIEGAVGLDQFAAERFAGNGISGSSAGALMQKTRVTVEKDLTELYPAAWPARVSVTTVDGRVLRGESKYPRGNPENPVNTAELEEKFVNLVAPRFGDAIAERALAIVRSIPGRADMSAAFDLATT